MTLTRPKASLFTFTSALIVLASIGCKKVEPHFVTAAPAPALQAGWKVATNEAEGLSIAMPQGWSENDPNQQIIGTDLDVDRQKSMMGGDPALQKMVEDQNNEAKAEAAAKTKERADNGLFLTVYFQTRGVVGEKSTRYSVKKIAGTSPASIDDAVQKAKDDMTNEDAATDVTLPIGPAKRIESDLNLKDGGTVVTVKYAMVNGNDILIVTFITESDPNLIKTIEQPVMNSFRVKPNS